MEEQQGANPYQKQIDNVKWECGSDGKLRIEVSLYGEGVETKDGNSMVARSQGWQHVDTRLWAGFAFSLGVIERRPGWEERVAERARLRLMTAVERKSEVMRSRAVADATRRGITVEEEEDRRDAESLARCWPDAARVYKELYGVPLPGYVPQAPRARREGKSVGLSDAAREKGRQTYRERRASGHWYDERGRKLSPSQRRKKKAEILAAQGSVSEDG